MGARWRGARARPGVWDEVDVGGTDDDDDGDGDARGVGGGGG